MQETSILWADDEIDLLKPHLLFLREKGYLVTTFTNGNDAIDAIKKDHFDLIFLDENMPGLTGLETLNEIKNYNSGLPVVMITKSEEENLMEDAIGAKIDDYLIKPVRPQQMLLTIKKIVDNKRLVSMKTTSAYQQQFKNLDIALNDNLNFTEWAGVYRKLVFWELSLGRLEDEGMLEILTQQKSEANLRFAKFIEKNYISWMKYPENAPVLSHTLFRKKVLPEIKPDVPTFFILIDNLRYDQWKIIHPILNEYLRLEREDWYLSILPTATQYSRNAIFSGLTPLEMERRFPALWQNDEDEGGKNLHEEEFLVHQLERLRRNIKFSYTKITSNDLGKGLGDNLESLMSNQLNVIVYNFVDMLSHARTEMEMIRELAGDEAAYRSLTLSWFEHSPLLDFIKKISQKNARIVITTDHGTIRVKTPIKVVGDRNTNTNLRYKQGKNLNYDPRDVFVIKNPYDVGLPRLHMSSSYIFARQDAYFIYPNNYNHFVHYFENTFQHGGISAEEMIIPFAVYSSK